MYAYDKANSSHNYDYVDSAPSESDKVSTLPIYVQGNKSVKNIESTNEADDGQDSGMVENMQILTVYECEACGNNVPSRIERWLVPIQEPVSD